LQLRLLRLQDWLWDMLGLARVAGNSSGSGQSISGLVPALPGYLDDPRPVLPAR
jgi:hypothetical protein